MPEYDVYINSLAVAAAGATVDYAAGVADGVPKRFPIAKQGEFLRTFVVTSRNLVLADRFGGVLSSTPAGVTVLTIPTFATLGYTRDATTPREFFFGVQRLGTGQFKVVGASGVTINDPNQRAIDNEPQYGDIVIYSTCGADAWFVS